MNVIRLVAVAAALLAVVGGYLQELKRLAVIKSLPGGKAREYYERTRTRTERLLTVVTAVLAALAIGGALWAFGGWKH